MEQVPRSLRYIYKQNKSLHTNNLRNIKPLVKDKLSHKDYKIPMDNYGFYLNNKKRNLSHRQIESENERMAQRILNIMISPRTQIEAQGYSKYHCAKRLISNKQQILDRSKNIQTANKSLSSKIINVKPAIGNMKQWSEHYNKFIKDSKIKRKYKYNINNSVIQTQYSSIRNGRSSCLERIQQSSNKRLNAFKSQRLSPLPQTNSLLYKRNSQIPTTININDQNQEQEATSNKSALKKVNRLLFK